MSSMAEVMALISDPLRDPRPPRPLPVALAHELARAKVSDQPRQALLGRLYLALSWAEQISCQVELRVCRMAKRGQIQAEVVG